MSDAPETPEPMTAAVVQLTSTEDVAANLEAIRRWVMAARAAGAELIALPENAVWMRVAAGSEAPMEVIDEGAPGPNLAALMGIAREAGAWLVVGSFPEVSPHAGRYYNTSIVLDPGGSVTATYRKLHLFDIDDKGWHTSAKKSNVCLLVLPYQELFSRKKLHSEKAGFSREGGVSHIVVYHSAEPVDVYETHALLKLRAIESRVITVCHAPNYKAIATTNSYKNIQFYGDIKDGDCVGLDLRHSGGLYSTVFSKDEKGKRDGIPKQFASQYLKMLD